MWSRLYRGHVMVAFPTYDIANHAWAPQVDISWFFGPAHDSKFVRFPNRFSTEDQAATWALARGQAWIDNHLKRLHSGGFRRRHAAELTGANEIPWAKANPQPPVKPKRPRKGSRLERDS